MSKQDIYSSGARDLLEEMLVKEKKGSLGETSDHNIGLTP